MKNAKRTLLTILGTTALIASAGCKNEPYETYCETYRGYTNDVEIGRIYVFDPETRYAREVDNRHAKIQGIASSDQIASWINRRNTGKRYCLDVTKPNSKEIREILYIIPDTSKIQPDSILPDSSQNPQ